MHVCYAGQEPPMSWTHAIFLAGPTPRDSETPSWRPDALKYLEERGYTGVVFVPEPAPGSRFGSFKNQVEWEERGLEMADRIVFWVPRDLRVLPGFTTNVEFGRYVQSGKVVLGHPEGAPRTRYLDWLGGRNDVPVFNSLEETLSEATKQEGILRTGGERYIPLDVWRTPMFQAWYSNLKAVGNRLDEARVRWTFTIPGKPELGIFSYILWAKIWVGSEGRWKSNEWAFARKDIASVVLYRRAEDPLDSKVILIREFRVPARTPDGFIHETPGGACDEASHQKAAAREVYEETGLAIHEDRLRYLGSRQAAGTLSSHQVHGYAVEITEAELRQAEQIMASGETFGEEQDSERTTLEVVTVRDVLQAGATDWTTVGLIMRAVTATY